MRFAVVATALLACGGCRQVFGLDEPVRTRPVDAADGDSAGDDADIDAPPDVLPVVGELVRSLDVVDAKVVAGPHVNFPMLVALTAPWLQDAAHGGDVARPDGFDIYFAADQVGISRLSHEVESYDPVTGALLAWVRVPALTGSTVVYLHYGSRTITTSQQSVAAVWTGYSLVMHLVTQTDASGQNTSITDNAVTYGAGLLSNAATFNGIDSDINVGSATLVDNVFQGGATIEAWIRPTGFGEANLGRVVDKGLASNWVFLLDNNVGAATLAFSRAATQPGQWVGSINAITLNAWQHVALSYDDGSLSNAPTFYRDGSVLASLATSNPTGSFLANQTDNLLIGNDAAGARTFDGKIDEVRVSRAIRTGAWLATQFANQSAPSTFYTVSSQL